ncbi:hypothetical protein RJE46_04335 [Cedecea neteri]|uniref:hypothetical protein n=1 Tax=Cedecea neteri TaxID=158822 RepID=UPI002892AF5A|nr:hypothetical protein [Cedecea neteri]WNJ80488.1 hypothetical protein RJE46_04335 [Cedecea neteri]
MTISSLGLIFYFSVFLTVLFLFHDKKWYRLTEKNLFTQKLFWLSIGLPLFSFFYFGIFSWWGKTPVLNAHGYSRFYEISKFPLMLLASSVPLGAIVNNIHRTIQTEAQLARTEHQIELIKAKNKSDSFYAHQKSYADIFKTVPSFIVSREFTEHDDKKKYTELSISHPYILYMNIFTKSSVDGGYNKEVSSSFMERTQSYYKNINKSINNCYQKETSYDTQSVSLQLLEINIIQLCRELGIDYRYEKHEFMIFEPFGDEFFTTTFTDEEQIKQMVTGLRDLLVHLYRLVGLSPEVFQTPKGLWDVIPDYGNDGSKAFSGILPVIRSE